MILENIANYKIILASKSPRRQQLLKDLGIDFDIVVSDAEEVFPNDLPKEEIPVFLANLKANALQNHLKNNTIIISADTIVWLNGEVINKPIDADNARNMLHKLSGNKHQVITGVCIKSLQKTISFSVESNVYFKHLDSEEINYYVDYYKPFDKAGAYGVQEWIGYVAIERIEGSYFNVMGLPVHRLYEELKSF